jgi:hypothetical protein
MTHLSAIPGRFVYRAATLCLIPNQKGASGAILEHCHQRWISFLAFKKLFELFGSKLTP